ncbi:PKD domain-containing protein [Pinibacter aurantiacus]|uniref:T9SS type A sorting domain-containing protein n=1 Tax=Pinibacter aurantiacus TaxID=2851599 RepID=A0A9E2W7X5_9BACT|nr:PKD domain-containing protein [Pinibacter aurantiacus]MBV4357062.1 T9SS type A sorting domain-containing protein [Pinibacter aurantiacus]
MKSILLIAGILCLSVFAGAQQVARSLTATNGKKIGFYEYKPTDYSKSKKYPLIIFLHGIGERGNGTTDLPRVLANATPRMIRAGNTMTFTNPKTGVKETFLVLTPQLDVQYGSWENFYVDEMLKYAKSNLSIDPNRVFLCGLSLGGGGVWKYATNSLKNANQFAGIIPCCGTGEGTDFCNLNKAKVGVWAFHAMDDGTVGVGNTQYAQIKLAQCSPAMTAKFTYYASGGHGIWERAFDPGHGFQNPNVYEWMLGLSRNGNNNDNQGQDNDNQGKPEPVPNVVPVANAGGDQAITLPVNTVTLNGTGSKDSDGTIKKYAWTKVSGPAGGTIASASASTTKVNGLTVGTYVFQLTVTDDEGATASDNVTVSVNAAVVVNVPPTADAGAAQAITLPVNTVTLNGTGSKDSDGKIKKYAWTKVSGPVAGSIASPSDATTKVNGLTVGTYVFQLTVTDDDGATASKNVTISVNAAVVVNVPPTADAGDAQVITLPVNSVTLNGTGSKDNDGSIKKYSWSKVSGSGACTIASPNSATTKVAGLVVGGYVFRLTVTDDENATSYSDVVVTVKPAVVPINQPPTADAGKAQTITLPANNVTLNGDGSKDSDGKIVAYAWTKISGPASGTIATPSAVSTQVTGLVAGAYIFNLTVTDNAGATASATIAVTVKPAVVANKPPVAMAGDDFSTANTFAYLSGAGSYDLDGSIVTWTWKQLSGPNTATLLSGNTMFPTIEDLVLGTYTFRLTVTDNSGASVSDEVKVKVIPGKAPIANAGKDFSTSNNYAYLSGGASYDPDGSIKGWAWSQVNGPGKASILSADGMFPTVQNLVAGAYTFRLKVTDNSGQSATDDIVVTVKANTAKSAVAGSVSTQALGTDVNAGSTKLNEIAKEPSIYPNPATNQITVTFNNDFVGNYKFVVYDVKGKIAAQYNYSKQAGQVQQQLDISKLPAGMYYLETIYEGSLKPVIKKFAKL